MTKETEILNRNGNFAYVCNRKKYYEDVQKQMKEISQKLDGTTQECEKLVDNLTSFKLNREEFRKILREEFEKRQAQSAFPKEVLKNGS